MIVITEQKCDKVLVRTESQDKMINIETVHRGNHVAIHRNNWVHKCPVCESNDDVLVLGGTEDHSVAWCPCGAVYITHMSERHIVYNFYKPI